jgi:LPS sulfotransferase NodH
MGSPAACARERSYDLAGPSGDFPRCETPPRRSIILCTHMRSGSTVLGEAMFHSGRLGCPLEYFHAGFRPHFEERWPSDGLVDYVAQVRRHRTDTAGTFSVKLFWSDLEDIEKGLRPKATSSRHSAHSVHVRALADIETLFPGPIFIRLARKDKIRQAVSQMMAAGTGIWRQIPGQGCEEPSATPGYDYQRIGEIIAYSRYCDEQWNNFFSANEISPYVVTYENLARDYEATVRDLFRHLGEPHSPIAGPRMRRQADCRSEHIIVRFLKEHAARIL